MGERVARSFRCVSHSVIKRLAVPLAYVIYENCNAEWWWFKGYYIIISDRVASDVTQAPADLNVIAMMWWYRSGVLLDLRVGGVMGWSYGGGDAQSRKYSHTICKWFMKVYSISPFYDLRRSSSKDVRHKLHHNGTNTLVRGRCLLTFKDFLKEALSRATTISLSVDSWSSYLSSLCISPEAFSG